MPCVGGEGGQRAKVWCLIDRGVWKGCDGLGVASPTCIIDMRQRQTGLTGPGVKGLPQVCGAD